MRISDVIITESYLPQLAGDEVHEALARVFFEHGKLTGNADLDNTRIRAMRKWAESDNLYEAKEDENPEDQLEIDDDDGDDEPFDPYGHLGHLDKLNLGDLPPIDPLNDCLLTLGGDSNRKLKKLGIISMSLPAGYSCPFAAGCKTVANRYGKKFKSTGTATKNIGGEIRCYAAGDEGYKREIRERNWRNFDLLKPIKHDVKAMADLITRSIQYHIREKGVIKLLRLHESGDFFTPEYFHAWVHVAKRFPGILFYGFTTSIPYWLEHRDKMPKNFRMVASDFSKAENLIDKNKLRRTIILKDEGEALKRKLRIDVDDFLAAFGTENFGLLLHGTQPAETKMTNQARANGKRVEEIAKIMGVSPQEFDQLLQYYTSADD